MSKLTKAQAKAHNAALELLKKDNLKEWEIDQVYDDWNESATVSNTLLGAHFTPYGLANDFTLDAMNSGRVLDACAGIGILSYLNSNRGYRNIDQKTDMVCIERNPDYVEIGKKLVPEAEWICADIFDLPNLGLGHFDAVISNPPFGRSTKLTGKGPRYTGGHFDLALVDMVADFCDYGTFILPQQSASFKFSGQRGFSQNSSGRGVDFEKATGLRLEAGCGVDCNYHIDDWKTVKPVCEIVCVDFEDWRKGYPKFDLGAVA